MGKIKKVSARRKKTVRSLAALMFCIAVAAGCAQQEKDAAVNEGKKAFTKPVYSWDKKFDEPLIIWGTLDLERSYIKKAFKRYEDITGNKLDIRQFEKNEFDENMLSAFQGNAERPDVILGFGGTNIEPYNPDENFYDFIHEPWVDDLTDTSIGQTIFHGRVIGLPHWEASISGTIYNKKIFDKYNLEVPQTQEEFMAVCEVLLKKGVTPLYLPGKEPSMLLYQFPLDSVLEDSEILEGLNDGTVTYEEIPEMHQIVDWYKTMAEKGYLGDDYLSNDWAGMGPAMESGEYAMMLCWDTWLYTDLNEEPENFGLMPAFAGVPEEGTFEGPNLGLLMVNKKSSKLESALNFITFLADPYNYNEAFKGIYTAPVFKNQTASISTPQYQETERLIERNFRNSTAWLRIRGFSQMDAVPILEYMSSGEEETAGECLRKMDELREERLNR